jgi:hypothetical protein
MAGALVERDRTLWTDLLLAGAGSVGLAFAVAASFSNLAPPPRAAASDAPTVAHLQRALGEVRRRPEASLVWERIAPGDPVRRLDAVYVPDESEAVLLFGDGARVEVDENSLVIVDRRLTRGTSHAVDIEVRRGGVAGRAGEAGVEIRAGGAKVRMDKGAAQVRLGKGGARVAVTDGQAQLSAGGASVAVGAGQVHAVGAGGAPEQATEMAIALVSPGAGRRIFFTTTRPRVSFKWIALAGRGPYRLELADDPAFERIITAVDTAATAADLVPGDEGVYYWRVVRAGRAAARSEERRLVIVHDAPPTPLRPRRGEVVYAPHGTPLGLHWSAADEASRYRVQVAADPEYARKVLDEVVDEPQLWHAAGIPEGIYHWRVRVEDGDHPDAASSASIPFRLITRPLPRAPRLFDPQLELEPKPAVPAPPEERGTFFWRLLGGVAYAAVEPASGASVVLRWEAVEGVKEYVIQIAEDRQFRTVVLQDRVKDNWYRWKTITQRGYFWRVKSIDAEGREGEFSPPRMVGAALTPPDPLAPPDGARFTYGAGQITLRLTPSRLATHHVGQVAADARFTKVIAEQRVDEGGEWSFAPPGGGVFYWRARSVDLADHPTAFGPARSVDVRLPSPRPRQPPSGTAFTLAQPAPVARLQWSREPAAAWEVQVARDAEFEQVTAVLKGAPSGADLALEETALHYWRARAMDGDGRWTEWGPSSWVRVRPAAPLIVSPAAEARLEGEGDASLVALRWHPAAGAAKYRVEIAKGEAPWDLEPPERSLEAFVTAVDVEGLAEGAYRWRVRSVDAGGGESEPSAERTFTLSKARMVEAVAEASSPEEPPLEAIAIATAKAEPPAPGGPAREPPELQEAAPPPRLVFAGPRVGAVYNFGDLVAPRLQLELGWRLPFEGLPVPFFVTFAAGYAWTGRSIPLPGRPGRAESAFSRVPIEIRAQAIFPTSAVDAYVGLGLAAEPYWASVRVPTQPELVDSGLFWGAVGVLGVERPLAAGAFFAEAAVAATSGSRGVFELDATGLTFSVGYRFGVM